MFTIQFDPSCSVCANLVGLQSWLASLKDENGERLKLDPATKAYLETLFGAFEASMDPENSVIKKRTARIQRYCIPGTLTPISLEDLLDIEKKSFLNSHRLGTLMEMRQPEMELVPISIQELIMTDNTGDVKPAPRLLEMLPGSLYAESVDGVLVPISITEFMEMYQSHDKGSELFRAESYNYAQFNPGDEKKFTREEYDAFSISRQLNLEMDVSTASRILREPFNKFGVPLEDQDWIFLLYHQTKGWFLGGDLAIYTLPFINILKTECMENARILSYGAWEIVAYDPERKVTTMHFTGSYKEGINANLIDVYCEFNAQDHTYVRYVKMPCEESSLQDVIVRDLKRIFPYDPRTNTVTIIPPSARMAKQYIEEQRQIAKKEPNFERRQKTETSLRTIEASMMKIPTVFTARIVEVDAAPIKLSIFEKFKRLWRKWWNLDHIDEPAEKQLHTSASITIADGGVGAGALHQDPKSCPNPESFIAAQGLELWGDFALVVKGEAVIDPLAVASGELKKSGVEDAHVENVYEAKTEATEISNVAERRSPPPAYDDTSFWA